MKTKYCWYNKLFEVVQKKTQNDNQEKFTSHLNFRRKHGSLIRSFENLHNSFAEVIIIALGLISSVFLMMR